MQTSCASDREDFFSWRRLKYFIAVLLANTVWPAFSLAQLPELQQGFEAAVMTLADLEDISGPDLNGLNDSTLIEMGRLAYLIEDYDKCIAYYLKAATGLSGWDKLQLSNALHIKGKLAMADDWFNAYLKSGGNLRYRSLHSPAVQPQAIISSDAIRGRVLSAVPEAYGLLNLVKDETAAIARLSSSGSVVIDKTIVFPGTAQPVSYTKLSPREFVYSSKSEAGKYRLTYVVLKKSGKGWKKAKILNASSPSYHASFPFYADGSLYYASDQSGGLGGFDLYRAQLRRGKLKQKQNLGPAFNTANNEVYPVVSGQYLYFSSNGLPGNGSYDLYKVNITDSSISRLPAPLNSMNSDWMVHALGADNHYVLRSTHSGMELGRFANSESRFAQTTEFMGKIVDEHDQSIAGALVYCTQDKLTGQYAFTREDGTFKFYLQQRGQYRVEARAEGHETTADSFTVYEDDLVVKEFKLPKVQVYQIPKSDLTDTMKDKPRQIVVSTAGESVHPDSRKTTFKVQENHYLAILGAAYNEVDALKLQTNLKKSFPMVALYHFPERSLFRAGIDLGPDKESALSAFYSIRKERSDVWLLRP